MVLPNYPILDAAGFAADDRGFVALQARAVFPRARVSLHGVPVISSTHSEQFVLSALEVRAAATAVHGSHVDRCLTLV